MVRTRQTQIFQCHHCHHWSPLTILYILSQCLQTPKLTQTISYSKATSPPLTQGSLCYGLQYEKGAWHLCFLSLGFGLLNLSLVFFSCFSCYVGCGCGHGCDDGVRRAINWFKLAMVRVIIFVLLGARGIAWPLLEWCFYEFLSNGQITFKKTPFILYSVDGLLMWMLTKKSKSVILQVAANS